MFQKLQTVADCMRAGPAPSAVDCTRVDRGAEMDRTFSRMEKISAVGAMIGALEQIVRSSELDDQGIFSWPLHRTRVKTNDRFPRKQIGKLLEFPNVVAIPHVRLLASARLVFGSPGPKERALLLTTLSAARAAMNVRHHYGNDGSDQISEVTFGVSLLAKMFPHDSRAREACLRFAAFQTCVSYASSGAIKLVSPVWRDGSAITGIMRTQTWGDEWLHSLLKRYPALAVALSWTVIIGELTFPLVLVAPRRTAQGILMASTVFHLANGRFMGLNRFVWGFTGAYPAVIHRSRALRP